MSITELRNLYDQAIAEIDQGPYPNGKGHSISQLGMQLAMELHQKLRTELKQNGDEPELKALEQDVLYELFNLPKE